MQKWLMTDYVTFVFVLMFIYGLAVPGVLSLPILIVAGIGIYVLNPGKEEDD